MERLQKNKVSVIMPAYNSERFIEKTIKSVLNQSYKNLELIIVNDYSKDNTERIIKKYKDLDNRIKYKKLNGNSGAAKVRNIAIEMSEGQYIAFLDSDDIWDSNKLEKQLTFMKEGEKAFSFTSYRLMDEEGVLLNKNILAPEKVEYRKLLKNTIIGCLTVMIDRTQIKDLMMIDVRIGEDTATWLKILRENEIVAYGLNEVLASYRVSKKSLSGNKIKAAKAMWRTYRVCENINKVKSTFYFVNYAKNAVLKRR